MSRKPRKSRTDAKATIAPTAADRGLRVVASNDIPSKDKQTAEDKVWTALRDNPGATTAKLALAAGVGRSTAAKLLARWDGEGTVIRTSGDSQRSAVTWTVPASGGDGTGDEPGVADVNSTETSEPAVAGGDDTPAGDGDTPADSATVGTPDGDTGIVAEEPTEMPSAADAELDEAIDTDDGGPAVEDAADTQSASAGTEEQQPTASSADTEPAAVTVPETKRRLPKGGLRGLVEDYLAEHPDESFGPTKIGKDLGRSGGAVNNALEKLVQDGYAIKTCEAPKRFQHKKQTADSK